MNLHGKLKKGPQPVSRHGETILNRVFGESASDHHVDHVLAKCESFWPQIAGPLSKHSQPVAINEGQLVVQIEKDVYAQEFRMFQRDILKRASATIGTVLDRCKIRRGAVKRALSRQSISKKEPLTEQEETFLQGLRELQ